jgi:methyl-accepting chemotaxis protein
VIRFIEDEPLVRRREIAAIMEGMNHTTTAIAGAVEPQGAATGEIRRNVSEASGDSRSVVAGVEEVRTAIGHTVQSAGAVEKAADLVAARTRNLQGAIPGSCRRWPPDRPHGSALTQPRRSL